MLCNAAAWDCYFFVFLQAKGRVKELGYCFFVHYNVLSSPAALVSVAFKSEIARRSIVTNGDRFFGLLDILMFTLVSPALAT